MANMERYEPQVIVANSVNVITDSALGGFLCTASGTITLVANAADGKPQTTLLNAFAVTAGAYYPLPFFLGNNGGTLTSASGAAGLLGTN